MREILAGLAIATYAAAVAFWLVFHGLLPLWRRIGLVTYPILVAASVGLWAWLWSLRGVLVGPAGPREAMILWPLALVVWLIAMRIEFRAREQLTLSTLIGVPELRGSGELLCAGIYSRIRHPRYLAVLLGAMVVAIVANHAGTWIMMIALPPALWAVTVLEERELLRRFGGEWDWYRRRVRGRLYP